MAKQQVTTKNTAATGLGLLALFGVPLIFAAIAAREKKVPGPPPPEPIEPEVLKYFIRPSPPAVSIAYSGWMGISCPYISPPEGTVWNTAVYGASLQIGVVIRNNDSIPRNYKAVIYNYHWTSELTNDYITEYMVMGIGEPLAIPPAPTGMPFSNYEYEPIDKLIPAAGAILQLGEKGFIYTGVFSQSRRFNTVFLEITCDGVVFGPYIIFSGWYSY